MIIFKDFLNGGELCSDALPSKLLAGGAVVVHESKKVQIGAGAGAGIIINTGANASAEEADEALDDSVKTVLNIVESHGLQQIKLEKGEYVAIQVAYWRALLTAMKLQRHILIFGSEEKIPPCGNSAREKEEFARLESAMVVTITDPVIQSEIASLNARLESFKKHFSALQKFIKEEVLANFSEFDFYLAGEPASIAAAMIVPARYIGEALAPSFYYFVDGLTGEKS
jgi:Translationally controlled tumour protein.